MVLWRKQAHNLFYIKEAFHYSIYMDMDHYLATAKTTTKIIYNSNSYNTKNKCKEYIKNWLWM